MRLPSLTLCILALVSACSRPVVIAPLPSELQARREAEALEALRRLGRDGDWLVIRGRRGTDNLVSLVTNAPFSHAAVLDLGQGQVIEADARGVHATPLPAFLKKAHRLLLVRPVWSREDRPAQAVAKARALVGRPYDFSGLVGLDVPSSYYCSELAVAVYRPWVRASDHVPPVIPPDQLHYWGRILFDSGNPDGEARP
jgi:hypothetical protein